MVVTGLVVENTDSVYRSHIWECCCLLQTSRAYTCTYMYVLLHAASWYSARLESRGTYSRSGDRITNLYNEPVTTKFCSCRTNPETLSPPLLNVWPGACINTHCTVA